MMGSGFKVSTLPWRGYIFFCCCVAYEVDGSAYVHKFPSPPKTESTQQKKEAERATTGTGKRSLVATKKRGTVETAGKRSRRAG